MAAWSLESMDFTKSDFPCLKCFVRQLQRPPSVAASLWAFLPSGQSSATEKHAGLGWDQATGRMSHFSAFRKCIPFPTFCWFLQPRHPIWDLGKLFIWFPIKNRIEGLPCCQSGLWNDNHNDVSHQHSEFSWLVKMWQTFSIMERILPSIMNSFTCTDSPLDFIWVAPVKQL